MRFLRIENCEAGMVIAKDILSPNGVTLLRAGNVLKNQYIENLRNFGYKGIYIEDNLSKGIHVKELVNSALRNETTEILQDLFGKMKFITPREFDKTLKDIEELLDEVVDQIIRNRESTVNIMSLKTFDQYTYQHSVDVSILSVLIGKELKLQRPQLISLGTAAMFHDLGKMLVPLAILNKPGKLTESEFDEIKKHPEYGYTILKEKLNLPDIICEVALHHHERYNGAGYPHKLKADDIPFFAKIVAVADTYDAMTSKRVYKDAILASEAYEYIMSNAQEHFDPEIAKAFLKKVAPFPVGTTVMLSNGKQGIVTQNHEDFMMRPMVKLAPEHDGAEGVVVDLAIDPAMLSVTITQVL